MNARCEGIGGFATNVCTSDDCMKDDDCKGQGVDAPKDARAVCMCGEDDWHTNRCLYGDCRSDDECPGKKPCSPSQRGGGGLGGMCGEYVGFFCHRDDDECRTDADCTRGKPRGYEGPYCAYDPDKKHWRCSSGCGVP